jgi:Histidine kinase
MEITSPHRLGWLFTCAIGRRLQPRLRARRPSFSPAVARAVDSSPSLAAPRALCLPSASMKLSPSLLRQSWQSWTVNDMQRVGPYWLQLVWTFAFCAGLAVIFTLLGFVGASRNPDLVFTASGWLRWYARNLVVCLVIGYIIHALFELARAALGRAWLRQLSGWRASLFFAGVPLLGVVVGWPLGVWLVFGHMPAWLLGRASSNAIVGALVLSLLISAGFHLYFSAKVREVAAEKRASEAQLRLLQAQMEPHFLFNTLANVQALIAHEPALAQQMLASFTDYLRATLTQLRSNDSTVAAELALGEAYLRLLATRMHERLRFSVQCDERARAAVLPPLLLQPLVENAVHHGLEPKIEGGSVSLTAEVRGATLVLEVRDDGLGLAAQPRGRSGGTRSAGSGLALANLRQRLRSRYGEAASFELIELEPGTLARITLPCETAPATA